MVLVKATSESEAGRLPSGARWTPIQAFMRRVGARPRVREWVAAMGDTMNTPNTRLAHWARSTDAALDELKALAVTGTGRVELAQRAASIIREMGGYRWVGLYDVRRTSIVVIAWDGPAPPQVPSFPLDRGLNGAAVAGRRIVVAADVSADSRHLPTIAGTRSEIVVPAFDAHGRVAGTINVESAQRDAFCIRDEERLTACADALVWLWRD